MIPYKEKKEAIESLLSKNIIPSMEALQYYFPTLIGQCRAQNALSDLVNVADYLRHQYICRNADVKLTEFQTPVQKQVRLYSRKKATKKSAPPRISTTTNGGNDNCNDAMSKSTSISSTQETTKSLPQHQECEETMDAHQALSFRFQSRTPQKPIPCTQKADAEGFTQVKRIVKSMMKQGEWPNYPNFVQQYPDLGQKYQKQSLRNAISRLRLLFDSNGHEKEYHHEKDSQSESQELENEKLDEDSTGETTEDSEESQECEWNEDTFIHRQIACIEQNDPKGYVKIRNIVLDLLQKGQKPSYPFFVERYPNIVAKYRERSLMSVISKIVAEEGKLFSPESSDSENEDDDRDEDTVIMDVSDFDQDDEMNVVESENEIQCSEPVLDATPQGAATHGADIGKSTIRGNHDTVEKPILKEQCNLLHAQTEWKCLTCFSTSAIFQKKCSTCSSCLTETFEDEEGNKISLNSSLESDEPVQRGSHKRKFSNVTTGDCSNGENDAPKAKKHLSPNNVTADDIVNEVDESVIDSSILVCERLADGSPSVKYTSASVLNPMIKCNTSDLSCMALAVANEQDSASKQNGCEDTERKRNNESYNKEKSAIVRIPFTCASNPKDYKRVKAIVAEMLEEGLETTCDSLCKKYPEFEEKYTKNTFSAVISAFKHGYKKKKSQKGRKVVESDPRIKALDKNEVVKKTIDLANTIDRSFSSGNNPLEISGKVSELFFSSANETENSTTNQSESCKNNEEVRKYLHAACSIESPENASNHSEKATTESKEYVDNNEKSSGRSIEAEPYQDSQEDKFDFINHDGSYSALNDIELPLNIDNSDAKSSSSQQNAGELTKQIMETPKKTFAVESFDLKSPFGVEKMSIAIWFNKEILKINTPSILSKCKEYSEKFVELGFYNEDMIKSYCTVDIIDSQDFQWMALVHRMCLKKWISNAK